MPAAFGLPGPRYGYAALIRRCPGLLTYWPGTSGATTSVSNYTMPSGAFTMECWFKMNTVTANQGIYSLWSTNGPMLWLNTTGSGQLAFHVNASDVDSGLSPTALTWYHAVAVYDGTNRSIYVNGQLKAGPTSGVTPTAATTPLVTHNYVGGGGNMAGTIADPAIYSRDLSAAEIYQHYVAGLPRT